MGKVNEYSLELLENWGDSVDIYYTQFRSSILFKSINFTKNGDSFYKKENT